MYISAKLKAMWRHSLGCLSAALLFSTFPTTGCHAQGTIIDTVRYRFSYAIKGTLTETSKRQYDDELNVDIGDSVSYCYSRWQKDNDDLWSKVKASGGNANDFLTQQGPTSLYNEEDLKHYPKRDNMSVITFSYRYFLYSEKMPDLAWALEPGDTTIIGYPCKKATCTFRGRTWTAWYAMAIPIQDGPWKLGGLPGMILYANDQKGQFSFTCIGIKANVNTPMEVNLKRTIKSTPLKVQRLKQLEESNYEAYSKAVGIKGIHYSVKSKPRVACLKEYYR